MRTKMKTKYFLFLMALSLSSFFLFSCIGEEPLNPEARILLDNDGYAKVTINEGLALSKALFNGDKILITVSQGVDVTNITPIIEVTEGSTISPASGVPQDFTTPVIYKVTSQDGKHIRTYQLAIDSYIMKKSSFNIWRKLDVGKNYETPLDWNEAGKEIALWASSNKGVSIYKSYDSPELYPVHALYNSLMNENAAVMETKEGPGSILGIQYIPIVAGSLFTGTLNLMNALSNPLTATQFGMPYGKKPLSFKGYYNYKAGAGNYIMIDPTDKKKSVIIPNKKDQCSLYAILYKVDRTTSAFGKVTETVLDGTNIQTHPNIVARAILSNCNSTAGDTLIPFDIPFVYEKTVDFVHNKYKLAIVFSSSARGDMYEGTVGSKLIVDEIELVTE